jgi:hypothetical protein
MREFSRNLSSVAFQIHHTGARSPRSPHDAFTKRRLARDGLPSPTGCGCAKQAATGSSSNQQENLHVRDTQHGNRTSESALASSIKGGGLKPPSFNRRFQTAAPPTLDRNLGPAFRRFREFRAAKHRQ